MSPIHGRILHDVFITHKMSINRFYIDQYPLSAMSSSRLSSRPRITIRRMTLIFLKTGRTEHTQSGWANKPVTWVFSGGCERTWAGKRLPRGWGGNLRPACIPRVTTGVLSPCRFQRKVAAYVVRTTERPIRWARVLSMSSGFGRECPGSGRMNTRMSTPRFCAEAAFYQPQRIDVVLPASLPQRSAWKSSC